MIYEAPPTAGGLFDTPVALTALGAAKEPTIAIDGLALYYTSGQQNVLMRSMRPTKMDPFPPGAPIAFADSVESPSVSSDEATIYFSDYASGERIEAGTLAGDPPTITSAAQVGTFQGGDSFFDPNISRDDLTLVYASNFGLPHARLFYVTRTCM
jgi:hypothetical protein